jgi:hypothetical protein
MDNSVWTSLLNEAINTAAIPNIDARMPIILTIGFELRTLPVCIAIRTEKLGPHIIVDPYNAIGL